MTLLAIFFGAALTLGSAWALGALLLRRLASPPEIALALGAAVQSLAIFGALLVGLADWRVFLALAAIPVGIWAVVRPRAAASDKRILGVPVLVLAPYLVWYLVNALAPETMADGITYHLGLPVQYLRTGGFPAHVTFYGMVPQGMEMLYTMAFAFGRHSAAKLVEFTFFVATLPLIFRIGRRLGMSDLGSLVAAVFYFCAPVVGLTGSCTYNDAAGVFFLLAAFYLLLLEDRRYLFAGGILAGFCYAIKLPGILAAVLAFVWVVAKWRSGKPALLLTAGAALMIAPWMIRSAVVTGNPLAPLANAIFPNPYFHIATEKELAEGLRSFGAVDAFHVPWELAFGDRLVGTYGPLLLLLPIGLLALRRREGRWLWAAALLLALPWWTNTGARFLMPACMMAALALGMALPRKAAWAAIAIQAVLCWPQVIGAWETRYMFRLHEFPLAGALRIEPEPEYLRRHLNEYNVARMIQDTVPPDARTLALANVANAYLDRDVAGSWQSADADQALDTIRLAGLYTGTMTFDWKAAWPEQVVRVLRFRIPVAYEGEWDISEIELYSGPDRLFNSPQWSLNCWPNRWEAPLALDGNLSTRWRTWENLRAGMYFEINLENPQRLTGAVLVSHTPLFHLPLEVYGQDVQGAWHLLSNNAQAIPRPPRDLRLDVAWALRKAGFRYLLVPSGAGGNAPVGNVILGHEGEWGLARAGYAGDFHLFRVK